MVGSAAVESTQPAVESIVNKKVHVTQSNQNKGTSKKTLINVPAAYKVPAGDYFMTLTKQPVESTSNPGSTGVESAVESTQEHDLAKRLVLLMVSAGVNSDEFGITITEDEIQAILAELEQEGKL